MTARCHFPIVSSREQLLHVCHGDAFEAIDDEIGAGLLERRFRVMADEAHGDALHAAGAGGLHAGHGILEDDAVSGCEVHPLGRHQKDLRVRLAALRVLRADHGAEEASDARQPQDQFEVGVRGAGADGLGETCRVQSLHELPHAR